MIIADDEFVKVSGVLLPGVFKSIEITGGALVEDIEVEGKGKKPKQATGYDDAKITIELILIDEEEKTKLEKLAVIQSIFKERGQKKPKTYDIINDHVTERNINKVIFKELSSKETNKKDELAVSLIFWEHDEITISASKKSSANTSAGSTGNTGKVGEDYQSYLDSDRGKAPKISDKTSLTPAVEENYR